MDKQIEDDQKKFIAEQQNSQNQLNQIQNERDQLIKEFERQKQKFEKQINELTNNLSQVKSHPDHHHHHPLVFLDVRNSLQFHSNRYCRTRKTRKTNCKKNFLTSMKCLLLKSFVDFIRRRIESNTNGFRISNEEIRNASNSSNRKSLHGSK